MRTLPTIAALLLTTTVWAQAQFFSSATTPDAPGQLIAEADTLALLDSLQLDSLQLDSIYVPKYESVADSLFAEAVVTDTIVNLDPLPQKAFMPLIYTTYYKKDKANPFEPDFSNDPNLQWVQSAIANDKRISDLQQYVIIAYPDLVRYNLSTMPEPPKKFIAEVNPDDHTITISEIVPIDIDKTTIEVEPVKQRHWIRTFNASLQFSQAYVSPNWYQGGNNNVNALLNLYYNVKLNQALHPKLLYENTFQYKLGVNNAPDDSIHSYNVTEDVFQWNMLLGLKATKKWYYSLTGQFKTQLVNSYKTNSDVLRSAFLSPGELTLGLGMTFSTSNEKKTMTFDASIQPLSYNMMICTNRRLDETNYGIKPGRKTVSQYGSSFECKLGWQITSNISLRSRVFGFTDYDRAYMDWENAMVFEINRFLTTQFFFNMRYDTDTPKVPDQSWKNLQLKELLSLGFSYKFSTL